MAGHRARAAGPPRGRRRAGSLAARAFAGRLAATQPGAFEVTTVPDAATADQRLRDRDAYAAFVLGPGGLAGLQVASAASPTVAQALTQLAQTAAQGRAVTVTDVVPTHPGDPRGAGLASALLPLVLTSVAAGVVLTIAVGSRWPRVLGLVTYAVLAGLVATAVVQYGLDALPGDYLANAAVVALLALAMAAAVAGLGATLGAGGVVLAVLLVFLLGNPLSGLTSAPELLPQPWGALGQLLPPGAGGTLLRSVAFFDGGGWRHRRLGARRMGRWRAAAGRGHRPEQATVAGGPRPLPRAGAAPRRRLIPACGTLPVGDGERPALRRQG